MSDLPSNVSVLQSGSRTFYILGTAHISEQSVADVATVIDAVKPRTVCIELCRTRYEALIDKNRWKKLDIFKVIKEGKTLLLLANLAIGSYQRRLGQDLGIEPGAEMVAAARKAEALGIPIALIDRDVQITLKRTWARLPFLKRFMLLGAVLESLFNRQKVSGEEIEKMKEKAQLSQMMAEFATAMPEVKTTLIDERDQYMMSSIEHADGDVVVAIVGAAHVDGMKQHLGKVVDRLALEQIPPPSPWVTLLKWAIPGLILAAFVYGIYGQQGRSFQEMLSAWILPTALLGGLFTALAGAKPLSVVSAMIASPITTLHPLLGAGMVVGLVEAYLRRPTVEDAERINEDATSLRGIYRNRFTRVLWVTLLSSVGAALGAAVGVKEVFSLIL